VTFSIAVPSPQSTETFTVPDSGSEKRFASYLVVSIVRVIGSLATLLADADEYAPVPELFIAATLKK
jgi:hypothetical protein